MRLVSLFCTLLLLCGLAVGQATIINGYASNWAPAYGYYSAPFVPLVTTPEVTLSTVSPWSAGASNSAFGLVAGATNSTLSSEFIGETPSPVYTQPVWYGQTEAELVPPIGYGPAIQREGGPHAMHRKPPQKEQAFDFISQPRESRESAATLIAGAPPARKASRTYTNQDVERMNQTNGMVKYGGKTQHI
jgi:hypothetical protein